MFKIVMMIKRRSDLTPEQFRDHYENVHVPLALSILTTLRSYVRNYPETVMAGAANYDAITELWFDSEEDWMVSMAAAQSPQGAALSADEAKFMDQSALVAMLVKECASTIG